MVSTRGVKLKFFEGERVLCYEPDPTKAKVLYDSKVLDVIVNKDHRGKKSIEYLIHFQGWNSSWDRCVGEEYVLKDTVENRQLQKDLAEKSQLHIGAYLYRKERKKNRKSTATTAAASSEEGSSGSPARMDTDDGQGATSSTSGDDSSMEDDYVQIDLSIELREILERDYYLVSKNKLSKLPAEPNIISILEMFWRHYATNQICGLNEKPSSRYRNSSNHNKIKPEDIQRNLNLCKEFVDGIRIYFDTLLKEQLLYPSEQGQVKTQMAVYQSPADVHKNDSKQDVASSHTNNHTLSEDSNRNGSHSSSDNSKNLRRRTLRSNQRQEAQTNGNDASESAAPTTPKPGGSSVGSSNSDVSGPLAKALSWQILPDHVYQQQPPPPCLVYGATHLLRLFVKLPAYLTASTLTDDKLKIVLNNIDLLLEFLSEHKEWYGEKFYIDAPVH
ncbi:male-specific lethal 3 homolog isoform X2 [Aethina tumida]|uniref:male-specific lethal 3 homolog isoform X2 n=1 Tax=Aethina tumida TaxID=116153 RepID=UPI002148CCDA|nr:male-specific lethal 3 homolog isoform X2 [Aethina tumida]